MDGRLNHAQRVYLNFLRAGSAMLVMFGHCSRFFLHEGWLSRGNFGVCGLLMLFLVSGFLISHSVFVRHRDAGYGFREFFYDRFGRLYAGYLPALFFVLYVDSITASLPLDIPPERLAQLPSLHFEELMTVQNWFGTLFMLQGFPIFTVMKMLGVPDNPWFIEDFGSAGPFWTISIEWWIYMAFGIIALCRFKKGTPLRPWQWAVLAFVSIEPIYYLMGGFDNCLTLLWIIGLGFSLMYRGLPAWLAERRIEMDVGRWRRIFGIASVAGVIFMIGRAANLKVREGHINYAELQFGLFLGLAAFSFLFFLGSVQRVPRPLAKVIDFLADYSYSLYLTHFTVLTYLYVRFPGHDHDARFFWLAALATNLVSIVFWWLLDRHYRTITNWLKAKLIPQATMPASGPRVD